MIRHDLQAGPLSRNERFGFADETVTAEPVEQVERGLLNPR